MGATINTIGNEEGTATEFGYKVACNEGKVGEAIDEGKGSKGFSFEDADGAAIDEEITTMGVYTE